MILKIFNHPSQKSADYIVSYLLSEEKHEGYKPELMQGSPELTRNITSAITRKQKYIAGCIRLRSDENLSEAHQLELINRFEKTFAPFDDPGRINFLWVRHKDKGGLELNFVCPRVDLKTAKAYNIHPPGKQTRLLVNCFIALENHRHGFKQINGSLLSDPLKKIEIVKDIAKQRAIYIAKKIDKSIKSPKVNKKQEESNGRARISKSGSIRCNERLANNSVESSQFRRQLQNIGSARDFIGANFFGQAGDRDLSKTSDSTNDKQFGTVEKASPNFDSSGKRAEDGAGGSVKRNNGEAKASSLGSIEQQIYALSLQLNEASQAQSNVLMAKIYQLRVQKSFQDAQAIKQKIEAINRYRP